LRKLVERAEGQYWPEISISVLSEDNKSTLAIKENIFLHKASTAGIVSGLLNC
jgi:hypothetical protein